MTNVRRNPNSVQSSVPEKWGATMTNGTTADLNGHGLKIVPDLPIDPVDLAGGVAVNRLLRGRLIQPPSLRTAKASKWFGELIISIEETALSKRRGFLNQWLKIIAGRKDIDSDYVSRVISESAKIVDDDPDEPEFVEQPKLTTGYRLNVLGALDFSRTKYRMDWAIKGILVMDQPAVMAASKKGMKTTIGIDLAISAALGLPFLGRFDVPSSRNTLFLSGESGGFVIQDTVKRICRAKGIEDFGEILEGKFFVGFELPRLSCEEQLAEVVRVIAENQIKLVIIDPLYLCLIGAASSGKRIDPANLFDMGPLFLSIAKACLQAGATPILVHHFKQSGVVVGEMPELENMAYAGIQEFARQWLLLSRRERFEPGTGIHKMWFCVGGSAGHSGEWAIDIDEGQMSDDFTGRKWDVAVKPASEIRSEAKEKGQAEAAEKKLNKVKAGDLATKMAIGQDATAALEFLRSVKEPITEKFWRDSLAWSGERIRPAIVLLTNQTWIQSTTIEVACGKGKRKVDGWQLNPNAEKGGGLS